MRREDAQFRDVTVQRLDRDMINTSYSQDTMRIYTLFRDC